MDIFHGYLRDFDDLYKEAEDQIKALSNLSGSDLKSKIDEIENTISEANQTIGSMTVAFPKLTNKGQAQDSIEERRVRMRDIIKRFKNARELYIGKDNRLNLFGGTDIESSASAAARRELDSDIDRLNKGSNDLSDITKRTGEIVDTGKETLVILDTQRVTMERARDRLGSIKDKLADSFRLISAVGTRMSTNDFMKIGIMLLIIFWTALIIYLRWGRRRAVVTPPGAPIGQPSPMTPSIPVPIPVPAPDIIT